MKKTLAFFLSVLFLLTLASCAAKTPEPQTTEPPEETSAAQTELTVACDAFSVTLPDWWKDKYLCEIQSDGITFRYKTSPPDEEGIYLFHIGVTDGPDDPEYPGFGGDGPTYEVCEIETRGRLQYLTVAEPGDTYGIPEADYNEYMRMLELTEDIETRLHGENGSTLRSFDYMELLGDYVAVDELGGEITLSLNDAQRNLLIGQLSYRPPYGYQLETVIRVTVRMFANAGCLEWYNETGEDEWEFGSGVFMQELDTDEIGYSLMLRAEGDSWTTTNGYLPLERVHR